MTPNPHMSNQSYLNKLAKTESGNSYTAVNKGSGAYGKYQFIPSTMKAYANRLDMTLEQAKTPEGQEAMIDLFTKDNRKGLLKAGIEPTDFNLYMAHQQGLGGAVDLLKHGKGNTLNMSSNLPSGTEATVPNFLAYWNQKF